MSGMNSKQRKMVYMMAIIVLLVPIVWLGMPSDAPGTGGVIAQKRHEYELGESTLGDVDPASATMNLVLLGLRGVATNLLWMEAEEQKRTKNWSQLQSTVESIILLQPHFQTVWKYQAWNLAYNVSAECDAVEDRFAWVKKGAKFLIRGTRRNRKMPELYHDTGDFMGKKIGRSDEKELFREFFVSDPDTVRWGGGPDEEINPSGLDNYLVAREWYERANEVLEESGGEQHKLALPLFVGYPYRSQMDYATARQEEGKFGEVTREAWATAYREWTEEYGREKFKTPGGDIMFEARDNELRDLAEQDGVALSTKRKWQDRYQNMVNYRYWKLRCEVERTQLMTEARRELFEGRRLFREEQDLIGAKEVLMSGMTKLQEMIDSQKRLDGTNPLLDETELIEDAIKAILIWQHVLTLLGEPVPETFPLVGIWNNPQYEMQRQELYERFLKWQGSTAG